MRQRWIVVAAALFVVPLLGAEAPRTMTLTFQQNGVAIEGATPRGTVYVYGLAREPRGFITHVVPRETKLVDEDGDGRVVWDLAAPLPWRSIWFAVDLESGNFTAGAPPEYVVATRIDFSGENLKQDAAGEVDEITFTGGVVELIAVRPKTGEIWGASVVSRGKRDKGRETGKVTLPTLDLDPRAGTTDRAPNKLKKGDVIFAMSSFRAEYAIARVGEEQ